MVNKKKIFFRILLFSGASYLVYKNWDRIIGKYNKLYRMKTMGDVIDDLGRTATNTVEGLISRMGNLYNEYFGEGVEPLNIAMQNEMNDEVKDLPINYATQLKIMSNAIVHDIRRWDNPDWDYQGTYSKKGKMAAQSFINWHNYYKLKGIGDFGRVTKIANIMLQYGFPFDIKKDTVRNHQLPTLSHYVDNPPQKFVSLDDVDWESWNENGIPPMGYSLKPIDLFRVIGDKIRYTVGSGRSVLRRGIG